MWQTINRITSGIRSRTRAQWEQYFSEQAGSLREYVQTQGEKAAIIAFCLGVFTIVFYKLAAVLLCLTLVGYQLILIISDSPRDKDT